MRIAQASEAARLSDYVQTAAAVASETSNTLTSAAAREQSNSGKQPAQLHSRNNQTNSRARIKHQSRTQIDPKPKSPPIQQPFKSNKTASPRDPPSYSSFIEVMAASQS